MRNRGVHPDPELQRETLLPPLLGQATLDRDGTPDRVGGARERNEEPITLVTDLLAAMLGDQCPKRLIVPADQSLPGLVNDRSDELGRAHDGGEEEGPLDGVQ